MFFNRQGSLVTSGNAQEKTFKVRIRDNPQEAGRKIIRMRIKGLQNSVGGNNYNQRPLQSFIKSSANKFQIPPGLMNKLQGLSNPNFLKNHMRQKLKNFQNFQFPTLNSGTGSGKLPFLNLGSHFNKAPSKGGNFRRPTYSRPAKPAQVYGPPKGNKGGQRRPTSFLSKLKNLNLQHLKGTSAMREVLKSTMTQASESLPNLSKAITVMSFLAFSVFVANLGINAFTNVSHLAS